MRWDEWRRHAGTHSHTHAHVETHVEDMLRLKWCGNSSVDSGEDARDTRTAHSARGQVGRKAGFGNTLAKE